MPVVSAARELTPPRDDTGLRTALRNVPLLPAPANVDDLLARLDAEEVRFSSGPLADLISDARHVDPAPADDGFFAPVSQAANANRRSLARRLSSGLFAAALLTGTFLIAWNALLAPDAAPPIVPVETARDPEGDPITPPALSSMAEELMPQADVVVPREMLVSPVDLPAAIETPAPADATAFAGPVLAPVLETPELAVAMEAQQAGAMLPSAEPAAQSEPVLTTPAVAAEIVKAHTLATPPGDPAEPLQPEPLLDAVAPAETFVSLEPTAPAPATAEAAEREPAEANAIAQREVSPPDTPAPEMIVSEIPVSEIAALEAPAPAAADAIGTADAAPVGGGGAVQPVEPVTVDTPEPTGALQAPPIAAAPPSAPVASGIRETVSAAPAESPVLEAPAAAHPVSHEAGAGADPVLAEPAAPVKPTERVPFAGIWAANAEACSPAMQEEGHLLARIGAWGGRAGDTSCLFKTLRRKRNTWSMNAACSDGETSWRSNVRLSLSGGRLIWASQKGSTTYMRCPRA